MVDYGGENRAAIVGVHYKMLNFARIQRIGEAIDLDRIVARIGGVEICSCGVDGSPARSAPRVGYVAGKAEMTLGIIGVHGYLADGRDIHVQDRKKRMRAHAERLVAPGQPGEDRI